MPCKGDKFKKRLGEFKKRLSQILLPWPAGAAGMGRGVALVCVSLALHAGADHLRSRGHQLAARPHAPGPSAPPQMTPPVVSFFYIGIVVKFRS